MLSKFELKMKDENALISTGVNTELWIDGIKAKGVKSVNIQATASGVNTITVEYIGQIEVDVLGLLELKVK